MCAVIVAKVCFVRIGVWVYECDAKPYGLLAPTQMLAPPRTYHEPVALGTQEADDLMLLNDIAPSFNRGRR